VWALLIIEGEVPFQALVCRVDRLLGGQIDRLVFDALPESFHAHVVPPTPFPVHANLDAVVGQESRELLAGELASLIGVEDGRGAIPGDRLLHRVEAELGRPRVGEPPRQHPTTRPVEDGEEIHETPRHRDVGAIGGSDVMRP